MAKKPKAPEPEYTSEDSFGAKLHVGDYIVFAVKARGIGSLDLGLITKITESGSILMRAVSGFGMSPETARARDQESINYGLQHHNGYLPNGLHKYGMHKPWYGRHYRAPLRTYKAYDGKRIASGTTTYKIPGFAVPPELIQALQEGNNADAT